MVLWTWVALQPSTVGIVGATLTTSRAVTGLLTLRIVPDETSLAAADRTADAVTRAVRDRVERVDRVTVELVAG